MILDKRIMSFVHRILLIGYHHDKAIMLIDNGKYIVCNSAMSRNNIVHVVKLDFFEFDPERTQLHEGNHVN